jgi:hypothetical protein
MATQTLANADAILKDLYVGPVVEQLNNKTYMLEQIERDSEHIDLTGRRAIIPLHTNRNRGRGSRGDGGTLPNAGRQSYQDAIVKIRGHFSGIEVTDQAIKASQSNEGAFINILDAESKGCAEDMRKDINRQVFGEGTGILAGVREEVTATTEIPVTSVQYIYVGDPVDILKKSNGAVGEGVENREVTKRVGGTTKKITISGANATKVTTEYGVYLAGSYGNEMDGLRNIIAKNRTLHEINSSTAGNEFWNGRMQEVGSSESSTAVAGETSFEKLSDEVGLSGNGETELYLTTRGIRRRLADTYQSQKRFNDANSVTVHGGYKAIMVASGGSEVPVIADDDAPRGYAFALNKESFRWYELGTPGWMEQGGGGIFHLKDGSVAGSKQAVWQAWFSWYAALGNISPNRNGVLLYCTDDEPTGEGEV